MVSSNNNATICGRLFQSQSNQFIDATLELVGDELIVRDDAQQSLCHAPISQVKISPRLGKIARDIVFPNQMLFSSFDNDKIDQLLINTKHAKGSFIHNLEAFRPRLIGFILLSIGLIYVIYRVSLPVLVEVAVNATPPQFPKIISKSTLATMDRTILSKTKLSVDEQNSVTTEFAKLTDYTPLGSKAFKLHFRKASSRMGPNAFALPDGSIVVTDALVQFAKGDKDMIAGVLAHEIGHVECQHSLREIYRSAGVSLLIMFVTGDVGELLEHVLLEGNVLLSLSYSRAAEAEADSMGIKLMHKAGYNPEGLARFFVLLAKDHRSDDKDSHDTSVFDTHPSDQARIDAIHQQIQSIKQAD